MGFDYLGGLHWRQITRDERFFCQHLFRLIEDEGIARFVNHINETAGLTLDTNANWEAGYEVCFYRDLWFQKGKQGPLFSPKRTFDLCLFSDRAMVVIEAKAQQDFQRDQLGVFALDRDRVCQLTGVRPYLVGLASSSCTGLRGRDDVFDGALLTWAGLAALYGDDAVLRRADAIYEPDQRASWGKNNAGGHMSGEELLAAYAEGTALCVGRRGGLNGQPMLQDIRSGEWRARGYETSPAAVPPNRNWFHLEAFVAAVSPDSAEGGHP